VFLLKGGCLRIIKAFQKCAQKVCSLFFLSFSVVYYAQRRLCDREREKDLNASLNIQNLTRCGCVVVVVGLNKDEFYLEHEHHRFGVAAVFDNATS